MDTENRPPAKVIPITCPCVKCSGGCECDSDCDNCVNDRCEWMIPKQAEGGIRCGLGNEPAHQIQAMEKLAEQLGLELYMDLYTDPKEQQPVD